MVLTWQGMDVIELSMEVISFGKGGSDGFIFGVVKIFFNLPLSGTYLGLNGGV